MVINSLSIWLSFDLIDLVFWPLYQNHLGYRSEILWLFLKFYTGFDVEKKSRVVKWTFLVLSTTDYTHGTTVQKHFTWWITNNVHQCRTSKDFRHIFPTKYLVTLFTSSSSGWLWTRLFYKVKYFITSKKNRHFCPTMICPSKKVNVNKQIKKTT